MPRVSSEALPATSAAMFDASPMLPVTSAIILVESEVASKTFADVWVWSSTALAIAELIACAPSISSMIWPIAPTDWRVKPCMSLICSSIFLVAAVVSRARSLTSFATTAKPLPASPADAASIEALSESRLVWSATFWISATILPVASALCVSSRSSCCTGVAFSAP